MYRYTAEILIAIAAEKGASDVHLIAGLPPKCRIDGQIRSLTDEPLSYEDCEELGRQLAGEHVRRIDQINQTRPVHIITLEDPIEYVYTPQRAIINQREVGVDVEDYEHGLYASLREDPDVILIGEMRTPETIETALVAAETGHLVFSTLHTNSAVDSIDRIVGVFPENKQPQIRLQLSMTLKAVLAQQLVPRAEGKGRTAACELMMITTPIRNLIRDGRTPQMQSYLLSGAKDGSVTMDHSLLELAQRGVIMPETAMESAYDPAELQKSFLLR